MSRYKNPIPNIDDKPVAKKYYIAFTFEERVTKEEATEGINNLIAENGGKVSENWVGMGEYPTIRYALPQKQRESGND